MIAWITILAIAGPLAHSQQADDLTQKSLEDLMNIAITSVSKKEQRTSEAPAAIFVISREDIRRSGALNIPDLLRMVPGIDVGQIDTSKWAISARGFNGQYSDKLLVLVDGRTIYTPIFAGVYWDSQNIPLDTIERVEVIRGPGAAVWGANAVNGVINIITRTAGDTPGSYVVAGAGSSSAGPVAVRYGGNTRNLGAWRFSAEGFHYNALPTLGGLDGHDDWRLIHGGFRTDSNLSLKDSLTTEAEAYQGNAGERADTPVSLDPPENAVLTLRDRSSGWNVLTRWNRVLSPRSQTSLQVYFDRTSRGDTTYSIGLNTFDIDFQHDFTWNTRQDLVWGFGYRVSADSTNPTLRISFTPKDRATRLLNFFAQDDIAIRPNSLKLSLGARVERNDYTGFELQPSARLVWTPNSKNMFWGGISGADRTPARSDTDLRVNYTAFPGPGGLPALVSLFGNPNDKNEHLTAFEAGYRDTWTSRFSLDLTVFYNRYRDLASVEPGTARLESNPAPVHLLIPNTLGSGLYGETHGIEVFANWKVARFWTMSPGYSLFCAHLHPFAGSRDLTDAAITEGSTPDHQAQLRSSVSLPGNAQWNTAAYFVNRLPAVEIPSYTRLDTNLIWDAGEHFSLSLVGQNLQRKLHPEFSGVDDAAQSGLIRRDAYARIAWSF